MAQLRDQLGHLEAGQLAALPGLCALGHLDFDLAALVEILRRHAETAGGDLLHRRVHIVAIGQRTIPRTVLAAFSGHGLCADPVHRDVERAVSLRRQCAERHAGRYEALADLVDRLDLRERNGRAGSFEIEQVSQLDRIARMHRVDILAIDRIVAAVTGSLQRVDQVAVERVQFVRCAQAVETANGQRDHILIERLLVTHQRVLLEAGKAEARDAARHAGEIIRHQRAAEAERFKVIAAAIGGDDRDAHLRDDLQETRFDGIFEVLHGLAECQIPEQAARMTVGDRFLCEIGIDASCADADEDSEIVRIQTFSRAHGDRAEGSQALRDEV